MNDTRPVRVRRSLLVLYVIVGSIALFTAMMGLSFLLLPEGGVTILHTEG